MQLIQTPFRILLCELILAFQISIGGGAGQFLSQITFFEHDNDFLTTHYPMILKTSAYTLLLTLLFSITTIIYHQYRKKPLGLRFIINHHGIHYGEYDEMITVPWQTFVGMQIQGTGPFQRVIIFALNQEKPLVVKLKAFNSAQREEFKLILKQKIRFYHPLLNNRYIPE